MAREMLIQLWCDRHLRQQGERVAVDSEPPPVMLGGVTRVLTLCEECAQLKLTLAEWEQLLIAVGTRPDEEAKPPSPAARRALAASSPTVRVPTSTGNEGHLCPIEGCIRHTVPYGSRGSLATHVTRSHGATMSELGLARRREDRAEPCPVAGCDLVLATGAGKLSHLRAAHPELLDGGTRNAPVPCPAPGCTEVKKNNAGMSAHVRARHPELAEVVIAS